MQHYACRSLPTRRRIDWSFIFSLHRQEKQFALQRFLPLLLIIIEPALDWDWGTPSILDSHGSRAPDALLALFPYLISMALS